MGRGRPTKQRLTPDEGAMLRALEECGEADLVTSVCSLPGEERADDRLERAQRALDRLVRIGAIVVCREVRGGPSRLIPLPPTTLQLRETIARGGDGSWSWVSSEHPAQSIHLALVDPKTTERSG